MAEQLGWGPFVDDLSHTESQRRTLLYLGYERVCHNIKTGGLRAKLSALRWHHVSNCRLNPYDSMELVSDWLRDLQKIDGPSKPKIPVPITVLAIIMTMLEAQKPVDWQVKRAAVAYGMFYLARSCMRLPCR